MSYIDNVSPLFDSGLVFLIFILAFYFSVIPEKIKATKAICQKKSIEKRYSNLLKNIDKSTSIDINNIMFNNMDDGVIVTDSDNNITMVNPSFERLTGYEFKDVIGQNPRILSSGDTPKEVYKKMWNDLLNNGRWEGILSDKTKDGKIYKKFIKIYTVKTEEDKIINFIGIFFDVDSQKEESQRYINLAMYDNLTGIPNRNLFFDRVETVLLNTKRSKETFAIFFIDLDDFKNINDVYGHKYGDVVLKDTALRIQACLRDSDTVSRLGGDEFAVILRNVKDDTDAGDVAAKVIKSIEEPIYCESFCFSISASIGVVLSDKENTTSQEIIQNADIAMYKAKENGKGSFEFFNDELKQIFKEKVKIETNLNNAILNNELSIMLQPQVDCKSGKIIGAEALVRWIKDGKVLSPEFFLHVAEKSRLIIDIDKHVFSLVSKELNEKLKELFVNIGYRFPISINLSKQSIQYISENDNNFIKNSINNNKNISFSDFEIEITESSLINVNKKVIDTFNEFKFLGLNISIDDFGTGHSSLSYIQKLPISKIKIDKSFIDNIEDSGYASNGIVHFIKSLSDSIGVKTIAEGVESKEQFNILKYVGVDIIQGYYYSRPLNIVAFCNFVNIFNHFNKKQEK